MKIGRVCLIAAVLLLQFIAACGGSQVSVTEVEAQVAIVAVSESGQYVDIRNNEDTARDLTGWYLSLGRRLTCHLGEEILIQPDETLRVWALAQDAGRDGYNCGLDRPFWMEKEPKRVFLYSADGQVMDSYFGGEG